MGPILGHSLTSWNLEPSRKRRQINTNVTCVPGREAWWREPGEKGRSTDSWEQGPTLSTGEVLWPRRALKVKQAQGWVSREGTGHGWKERGVSCMCVHACVYVHVCTCDVHFPGIPPVAVSNMSKGPGSRTRLPLGILSMCSLAQPWPRSFTLTPCLSFLLCILTVPTLQGYQLGLNGIGQLEHLA